MIFRFTIIEYIYSIRSKFIIKDALSKCIPSVDECEDGFSTAELLQLVVTINSSSGIAAKGLGDEGWTGSTLKLTVVKLTIENSQVTYDIGSILIFLAY